MVDHDASPNTAQRLPGMSASRKGPRAYISYAHGTKIRVGLRSKKLAPGSFVLPRELHLKLSLLTEPNSLFPIISNYSRQNS